MFVQDAAGQVDGQLEPGVFLRVKLGERAFEARHRRVDDDRELGALNLENVAAVIDSDTEIVRAVPNKRSRTDRKLVALDPADASTFFVADVEDGDLVGVSTSYSTSISSITRSPFAEMYAGARLSPAIGGVSSQKIRSRRTVSFPALSRSVRRTR